MSGELMDRPHSWLFYFCVAGCAGGRSISSPDEVSGELMDQHWLLLFTCNKNEAIFYSSIIDKFIIQYLPEQHAHYLEDARFKSKNAFLHATTNLWPVFLAVVCYTLVVYQ